MSNNKTALQTLINSAKDKFIAVAVDKHINFDRESMFAMQHLEKSQYAVETALKNKQSVVSAVQNIATIGISLNPAKREAYLVPRDGQICLDISYMGLMTLAINSGSILWARADIVYEMDDFSLTGYDTPPHHKYNPFNAERGAILGAYVVVKTQDGSYLTHAMPIGDIHAIRDKSKGWQSGKNSPWKTHEKEMIKKTVVKQAYKYWPKSDRVSQAIDYIDTETNEGTDFDARIVEEGDGYQEYEESILPVLVEASKKGTLALQEQFKQLENSPHKKTLWDKFKKSLKEEAEISDTNTVEVSNDSN